MATALPITSQTVGRTFTVAVGVLSVAALLQLAAIGWALLSPTPYRSRAAGLPAVREPIAPPALARLATPTPDFEADPFAEPGRSVPAPLTPPPKPTPIQQPQLRPAEPVVPETRFAELIEQGRTLRERGDMSAALVKLREAQRIDQKSPQAIFEIAATYEKMALPDKAAEQWRRIYDMGEAAAVYYTAAEAKLKASQAQAILQAAPPAPAAPAEVEGIASGAVLGLLPITVTDRPDGKSAKKFLLRIPLKAREGAKIEVRDLVIQIHFYDLLDDRTVVMTAANTNNRWSTVPVDWSDSDTEILEVEYQLPAADPRAAYRENRKYFGYLVRVYYKGQLQAAVAEPERLTQQYPAPPTLPKDAES